MPHACHYGVITDDPNTSQVAQLQREVELLRAERVELLDQLRQKDRELESVHHQLQALLRRYYGRSSEKMDPNQRLLFEDLIDKAIPEMPADDAGDDQAPPARQRKGHGRRRLPADLPREKVIHDLPEDEKRCPPLRSPPDEPHGVDEPEQDENLQHAHGQCGSAVGLSKPATAVRIQKKNAVVEPPSGKQ